MGRSGAYLLVNPTFELLVVVEAIFFAQLHFDRPFTGAIAAVTTAEPFAEPSAARGLLLLALGIYECNLN